MVKQPCLEIWEALEHADQFLRTCSLPPRRRWGWAGCSVYLALRIREASAPREDMETYLEELIVRRELTINFCFYTPDYDSFSCIPDWRNKP
jgi:hypothetical protein